MSFEGSRLLVDTCVWVDSYCPSHAGAESARRFLAEAARRGSTLLYAVHAAKDVLFVLDAVYKRAARRGGEALDEAAALAAHEAALGCTRNMCELATAVGADASDIWLADRYLGIHRDFEDNLVLAACKRAKADYLVTRDKGLIAHADVVAKTPEEMLALMELGV